MLLSLGSLFVFVAVLGSCLLLPSLVVVVVVMLSVFVVNVGGRVGALMSSFAVDADLLLDMLV